MDAMRARTWWVFLLLMAPVVGLYLFGPAAVNIGPVFNTIGLSAVLAIVVGVRLHRPRAPWAWYLFAIGQALFVAGDVLAYNYERFFGRTLPFPSVADIFYLGVGPSIVAGLLLLIRQRKRGADRASLIDSLIIATGLGLLSWIFLMAPHAHDTTLSLPVKLTSIAYPLMDLLMLSVAVRLAVTS
jgi:CDP-diglyceride synthetase